jgi:hypothetical protein
MEIVNLEPGSLRWITNQKLLAKNETFKLHFRKWRAITEFHMPGGSPMGGVSTSNHNTECKVLRMFMDVEKIAYVCVRVDIKKYQEFVLFQKLSPYKELEV